jgi:hypothetical protein
MFGGIARWLQIATPKSLSLKESVGKQDFPPSTHSDCPFSNSRAAFFRACGKVESALIDDARFSFAVAIKSLMIASRLFQDLQRSLFAGKG